jgi:ubiquinone/menaquinone biosynthesis C-methylase UbiE
MRPSISPAPRIAAETIEEQRIRAEYARRDREVDPSLYAPWAEASLFMHFGAARNAATMLYRAGVFPGPFTECLEVGYGCQGWLTDLIRWGVPERNLHGIELCPSRANQARASLPVADLRIGDASHLPWESNAFHLVVASTVFTSILDTGVRRTVAQEISRVLAPGGALLWYDFRWNNPRNPNVRKVSRSELRELYPTLRGEIRSVTLAPPLARLLAPRSVALASLVEAIPWLRTHLLAVFLKPI